MRRKTMMDRPGGGTIKMVNERSGVVLDARREDPRSVFATRPFASGVERIRPAYQRPVARGRPGHTCSSRGLVEDERQKRASPGVGLLMSCRADLAPGAPDACARDAWPPVRFDRVRGSILALSMTLPPPPAGASYLPGRVAVY
jgi:hypothetical protein